MSGNLGVLGLVWSKFSGLKFVSGTGKHGKMRVTIFDQGACCSSLVRGSEIARGHHHGSVVFFAEGVVITFTALTLVAAVGRRWW